MQLVCNKTLYYITGGMTGGNKKIINIIKIEPRSNRIDTACLKNLSYMKPYGLCTFITNVSQKWCL